MKIWLTAFGLVALLLGAAPLARAMTTTPIPAPSLAAFSHAEPPKPPDRAARFVGSTTNFARTNGPSGGAMSALAVSPLYPIDFTIFGANSYGGFYRSLDDGVTWSELTTGLPTSVVIRQIAVSVKYLDDRTLFLATSDGVYRSRDGGSTWTQTNNGISVTNAQTIVLSPAFAGDKTVFVGTDGGGVYRSTNGGDSWTSYSTGLSDLSISALGISANYANDCTIFAGSGGRSTFTGGTGGSGVFINSCGPSYTKDIWTLISNQRDGTGPLTNIWVTGLAVIPFYGLQGCPITGGKCWESWQVAVSTAFNGVWLTSQSPTGPWDWGRIDPLTGTLGMPFGGREASALAMSPDWAFNERRLIVGSRNGVFSGDFGHFYNRDISNTVTATVAPMSGWLNTSPDSSAYPNRPVDPNLDMRALAIAPDFRNNRTIWASPWGELPYKGTAAPGLITSTSQTIAWRSPADTPLNIFSYVWSTAAAGLPLSPTVVFAGTWGNGVHRSTDGGQSWARVAFSSTYGYVAGNSRVPAADVNDVRTVVASPNYASDSTVFAGTFGQGILRSNVPGNPLGTWVRDPDQPTSPFIRSIGLQPDFLAGNPLSQTVFAGTAGGGVHRSKDGGDSWASISNGLSGDGLSVWSMAVSPSYNRDQTIFIGTDGGIYTTTNAGAPGRVDVVWRGAGNITGTTSPVLMVRTEDAPDEPAAVPPPPNGEFGPTGLAAQIARREKLGAQATVPPVVAVALPPIYDGTIQLPAGTTSISTTVFAAVWGHGIYRSGDKGRTWQALTTNNPGTGMTSTLVRSLLVSPYYGRPAGAGIDLTIYAATYDQGIFRSMDNGATWSPYATGRTPWIDQPDIANLSAVTTNVTGQANEYTIFAGTGGRGVYAHIDPVQPPLPAVYLPNLRREQAE